MKREKEQFLCGKEAIMVPVVRSVSVSRCRVIVEALLAYTTCHSAATLPENCQYGDKYRSCKVRQRRRRKFAFS